MISTQFSGRRAALGMVLVLMLLQGCGISATVGNGPLQLTIGADTTIGRDNADAQVFRGTATYRF